MHSPDHRIALSPPPLLSKILTRNGVAALLSVIRAQSSSVQLPQDIADKFGAKCLDGSAPKCACMRAKHRTT